MVVYSVSVSVSGLVNDNGNYESPFPSFGNAVTKSFTYYWKLLIYTASDWHIPIIKPRAKLSYNWGFTTSGYEGC